MLAVTFVLGVFATQAFSLFWQTVPYPGQLLVVLLLLAAPVVGMVFMWKQLSEGTFTQFGRVALAVVCFMSLVPLTKLVLNMLRVVFR